MYMHMYMYMYMWGSAPSANWTHVSAPAVHPCVSVRQLPDPHAETAYRLYTLSLRHSGTEVRLTKIVHVVRGASIRDCTAC